MKAIADIIIKPLITEKATDALADKRYVFKVQKSATKPEIARAVEEMFDVKVASVNTINMKKKPKRMGLRNSRISVMAVEDSKVLLIDSRRITVTCANACGFHNTLVQNLLQLVSQKSLHLSRKIRFMSEKTTQDKLMAYLLDQAKEAGTAEFTIPLDRQGLADFLGVERSAMSAELSKLRAKGVLETEGSRFRLL